MFSNSIRDIDPFLEAIACCRKWYFILLFSMLMKNLISKKYEDQVSQHSLSDHGGPLYTVGITILKIFMLWNFWSQQTVNKPFPARLREHKTTVSESEGWEGKKFKERACYLYGNYNVSHHVVISVDNITFSHACQQKRWVLIISNTLPDLLRKKNNMKGKKVFRGYMVSFCL